MKIGFAFLVYRDIHNQQVWRKLFDGLLANDHTILSSCHAKEEFELPLLPEVSFVKSIRTKWSAPSLIEAQFLLFADLFEKGADIVYLCSGDMLPLPRSKGFISFNEETTFCVQDKFNLEGYSDSVEYDQSVAYSGVNQNKWNYDIFVRNGFEIAWKDFEKQAMFFAISKNDFKVFAAKAFEENFFNRLIRLVPMDEYFWINLFILLKISFRSMPNYLFCHKKTNLETQAQNFRLCMINDEMKDKYMFLRKIKQEGAEIEFI